MFSNRPRLAGTLVGLVVTALSTLAMFRLDLLRELELKAFDLRMRWCNDLAAATPIVHIDIDDGSLERVGRWPWDRDKTADIIRVIHELGAKNILIDLLFSESQADYYDDPEIGNDSLDATATEVIGVRSEANHVYPDLELAAAIRAAGNVILSVQMETLLPDAPDSLTERLIRMGGRSTDDRRAPDLSDSDPKRVERELLRLRMRAALQADFTLDEQGLANELRATPADVSAVFAGVKRQVAQELALRELSAGDKSLSQVKTILLGDKAGLMNADARDVEDAYAFAKRMLAVEADLTLPRYEMSRRLPRATAIVPPVIELTRAAADIAAVSFDSDIDGRVRRVPILIHHRGRLVQHLGLAAAARILDLDIAAVEIADERTLVIPRRNGDAPVRLPLDGRGNLIIKWTKSAKDWYRGLDFPHVPAAKLWALADARRQMRDNDRRLGYLLAEVVAAAKGVASRETDRGTVAQAGDEAYRESVNRYLDLEHRIHLADLHDRLTAPEVAEWQVEAAALRERIDREHEAAAGDVEANAADLDAFSKEEIEQDAELKTLASRFFPARKTLREDVAALQRANEKLARSVESLKAELSPHIKDKHVFLGYAATAEGDIVATPISPQTNGVMCHAQVLNSILQQSFITVPPAWSGILVCVLLGITAGFITATRDPVFALLATLILAGIFAAVNAIGLFQWMGRWSAAVPVLLTLFVVWAFVTLFRQLTAERDKRLFRKQLSQYTSPAIAAKIAESPEAARAFKAVQTRDMTCLFSDLKGFTGMTEREDAEVVQHVLNVYLERMSQVIWKHRGMINKFMGDGVMAIFNPSVDPIPDHSRAACEAALDAMSELERLKQERRANGDAALFSQLEMRLGIACGLCKNGDLGSELKADYTVIGDVVNLAARLEPANKVFGTSILVSGPLHERVKEAYEFRYLAELQVKGRARTTPVYEVLGRRGAVDAALVEYARRFEAGVELYKQRKWDECIVHFTRILARRPDDAGASRYIDACQELKTFPPAEDWTGTLELKEK